MKPRRPWTRWKYMTVCKAKHADKRMQRSKINLVFLDPICRSP